MNKKQFFIGSLLFLSGIVTLTSCSDGKVNSLQTQIDSLNRVVAQQSEQLDDNQSFLTLITESIDSLAMADSTLIRVATGKDGIITKESIKENLDGYVEILNRQRKRLSILESELRTNEDEMSKMASIINYLNKQIEAKDAQIKDLQEMLEQRNFDIAMLQSRVIQLYNTNSNLQALVDSQKETISVAQEMMNEAYYIIGTSKELKAAGVLNGKFMGKSKVDVNNINSELFNRIDIRKVTSIHVESSNPTIKSQHPSNSYNIIPDKKNKTAVIQIVDEIGFWSLTRYLIIQK